VRARLCGGPLSLSPPPSLLHFSRQQLSHSLFGLLHLSSSFQHSLGGPRVRAGREGAGATGYSLGEGAQVGHADRSVCRFFSPFSELRSSSGSSRLVLPWRRSSGRVCWPLGALFLDARHIRPSGFRMTRFSWFRGLPLVKGASGRSTGTPGKPCPPWWGRIPQATSMAAPGRV
jgi:hypothetical protein